VQVRRPISECVRALGHQQRYGCTRTSQCRSWRPWERRYGQRACSPRSIRSSWQANTLIPIRPSPFPYPRDIRRRARLPATSVGHSGQLSPSSSAYMKQLSVEDSKYQGSAVPSMANSSYVLRGVASCLPTSPFFQAFPSLSDLHATRPHDLQVGGSNSRCGHINQVLRRKSNKKRPHDGAKPMVGTALSVNQTAHRWVPGPER
jgi:hypothetical protein